jgi:glycosyltransferase 2 family protein
VRLSLLTELEAGRRNRRTIDMYLLLAAAAAIGLAAVIASSPVATADDERVAAGLVDVLGWAGALWKTAFVGLLILALVVLAGVVWDRRRSLVRDILCAVALVVGAGLVLGGAAGSDWTPVDAHVMSRWGYPELRLAVATAILVVAAPELVRPVRVFAAWVVPLGVVGAVAIGAALPSAALGALALGLAGGSVVRLVFGSAAGVPPTARIRAALAALDVELAELAPAGRQHVGAAEYVGRDTGGRPLLVRVLGRDSQDTQRLARHWRLLAYRDPPRSAAVGRLEQVEHEALATLMAAQAGVRTPEVVVAALDEDGDAVIVTRRPNVDPLELSSPGTVTDTTLGQLWAEVARLHDAGISHGRLNASNVLVLDGGPMLVDFAAATLGAPQSALDIDVAELLVACTILVGADRALAQARAAGRDDSVARVLPYLQRAALTPHLRDLARTHEVGLKELRESAAAATGTMVPDIAPLRRIKPKDVLVTAMIAVAAYLIITQLAQIGFGTIAHELRQADVAWVLVGLILAQLTFVAGGISLRGAIATPLPLLPCVLLQSAIKFINLTVPSSAGRIGVNIRFLQRMGAQTSEAVAAGAVDEVSETLIEVALVLVTLPFVDVAIDTGDLKVSVPSGRLITTVVVLLALVVVALLAVPKLRAKVLPPIRNAFSSLRAAARDRKKRLQLFGGNLASECLYALTLGAACLAYGVHLSFASLLLVNTAASAFSSLIPVPGGVGAAEASLTAGLVAMGVGNSTAFAVAFTHRLCTYYLPPIWGYFSMKWLERKAYI